MAPPSRSTWAAVLAACLACAANSARAAELAASGPAECADADELRFRVERSIGMPLRAAAGLRFDVMMERAAQGHRARIDVRLDGSDAITMQRLLVANDCEKLASAVSVAVALALGAGQESAASAEPSAAELASERASGTGPGAAGGGPEPAPAAAESLATDAGATERASDETASLSPALSLWLLGDLGSLPSPALGVALGAEVAWRRFELRALGTVLFEQQATLDAALGSGPGAKLGLMTAALSACAAPFGELSAPLAPVACLGMELGRLSGEGTGIDFPRRGSAMWAAPLAQLGVVYRVPRTSLQLSSTLLGAVPLNRDEFALGGIGRVHQPPSFIGRWSLGLGVQFD